MGIGRLKMELDQAEEATKRNRQWENEDSTEAFVQKCKETQEREKAKEESLADLKSGFYCELCNKQYYKQPEYDNHMNSYGHAHTQRIRQLENREIKRNVYSKRMDEKTREKDFKRINDLANARANRAGDDEKVVTETGSNGSVSPAKSDKSQTSNPNDSPTNKSNMGVVAFSLSKKPNACLKGSSVFGGEKDALDDVPDGEENHTENQNETEMESEGGDMQNNYHETPPEGCSTKPTFKFMKFVRPDGKLKEADDKLLTKDKKVLLEFVKVCSQDEKTELDWPAEMIQHTKAEPSLQFSCNPLNFDFSSLFSKSPNKVEAIKTEPGVLIKKEVQDEPSDGIKLEPDMVPKKEEEGSRTKSTGDEDETKLKSPKKKKRRHSRRESELVAEDEADPEPETATKKKKRKKKKSRTKASDKENDVAEEKEKKKKKKSKKSKHKSKDDKDRRSKRHSLSKENAEQDTEHKEGKNDDTVIDEAKSSTEDVPKKLKKKKHKKNKKSKKSKKIASDRESDQSDPSEPVNEKPNESKDAEKKSKTASTPSKSPKTKTKRKKRISTSKEGNFSSDEESGADESAKKKTKNRRYRTRKADDHSSEDEQKLNIAKIKATKSKVSPPAGIVPDDIEDKQAHKLLMKAKTKRAKGPLIVPPAAASPVESPKSTDDEKTKAISINISTKNIEIPTCQPKPPDFKIEPIEIKKQTKLVSGKVSDFEEEAGFDDGDKDTGKSRWDTSSDSELEDRIKGKASIKKEKKENEKEVPPLERNGEDQPGEGSDSPTKDGGHRSRKDTRRSRARRDRSSPHSGDSDRSRSRSHRRHSSRGSYTSDSYSGYSSEYSSYSRSRSRSSYYSRSYSSSYSDSSRSRSYSRSRSRSYQRRRRRSYSYTSSSSSSRSRSRSYSRNRRYSTASKSPRPGKRKQMGITESDLMSGSIRMEPTTMDISQIKVPPSVPSPKIESSTPSSTLGKEDPGCIPLPETPISNGAETIPLPMNPPANALIGNPLHTAPQFIGPQLPANHPLAHTQEIPLPQPPPGLPITRPAQPYSMHGAIFMPRGVLMPNPMQHPPPAPPPPPPNNEPPYKKVRLEGEDEYESQEPETSQELLKTMQMTDEQRREFQDLADKAKLHAMRIHGAVPTTDSPHSSVDADAAGVVALEDQASPQPVLEQLRMGALIQMPGGGVAIAPSPSSLQQLQALQAVHQPMQMHQIQFPGGAVPGGAVPVMHMGHPGVQMIPGQALPGHGLSLVTSQAQSLPGLIAAGQHHPGAIPVAMPHPGLLPHGAIPISSLQAAQAQAAAQQHAMQQQLLLQPGRPIMASPHVLPGMPSQPIIIGPGQVLVPRIRQPMQ